MTWPLFRFLGRNLSNFCVGFLEKNDINKTFWNQLTFNEIESTETDNAVKGEEDTATKIDIESFEQNLTESETTKLDVGVLEQNSTELEKKTAQIDDSSHEPNSSELEIKTAEIETEHVEDDSDNQNNDNSVEIDQDMNKPLVEFWTTKK